MPVKVYQFANAQGAKVRSVEEIPELLRTPDHIFWADIENPADAELRLMHDVFKFHPLAIEDTHNQDQRAKLEEYDDHLFLIVNTLALRENQIVSREIDVFVGPNYIVTAHIGHVPVIEDALRRVRDSLRRLPITPGFLLYTLADTVVDSYFPLLEAIGDKIEHLEESILKRPRNAVLGELMKLKRSLRHMWRVIWPQQEVFNYMTHHDYPFIDRAVLEYYLRDLHDHLLRITDIVNTFRETLTSVVDLYMSSVSNRMNLQVSRLTVITVCIGIAAIVTGFYGMNFETTWPPFKEPNGVLMAIGIIVILEILVLAYFKARKIL